MRRHDFVYLNSATIPIFPSEITNEVRDARVRSWIKAKKPFVIARQAEPLIQNHILLGLTLPLTEERKRISLYVHRDTIESISPSPSLTDTTLKKIEQKKYLLDLAQEMHRHGIKVGIYGSLAWEVLTGDPYLTPQSDIDLICDIISFPHAQHALSILKDTSEKIFPHTLDGEIRFPDEVSVAWKELAAAIEGNKHTATVLVKTLHSVFLISFEELKEKYALDNIIG